MNTKETGRLGEEIAVNYLKKKGYKILDVNFKNKWGEIDIIAKKKKILHFVEVKAIHKKEGFSPEDEISQRKQKQLLKMVQIYLSQNNISFETPHQIDVLAVELRHHGENSLWAEKEAGIRHIENAVEDNY